MPPEPGPPLALTFHDAADSAKAKKAQPAFDIYRYRLQVYGHYDQIGEFLADVASLPRIMVPQRLVLKPAGQQTQRLVGRHDGRAARSELRLADLRQAMSSRTATAGGSGECASVVCCTAAGGSPAPLAGQAARPDSARTRWRGPTPRRSRWCAKCSRTRAAGAIRSCRSSSRATCGPLITDLKLVTVIYDERYPARSVAVLRDITTAQALSREASAT